MRGRGHPDTRRHDRGRPHRAREGSRHARPAPPSRRSAGSPGRGDDVAFARLQAADPAAGAEPNLPALYAAVSDRTGVPSRRRATSWRPVAPVVRRAGCRSRRSSRASRSIGGGSYAYGLSSAPETVTAAPPISLGDGGGAGRSRAGDGDGRQARVGHGGRREADVPVVGRPDRVHGERAVDRGRLGRRVGVRRGGHLLGGDGGGGGCGARGVRAAAARVRHVVRRPERRLGRVGVAVARTGWRACPTTTRRGTRGTACGPRRTASPSRTKGGAAPRAASPCPEPAIVDPRGDVHDVGPGPDG